MKLEILNIEEYEKCFEHSSFQDSYCACWKKPSKKKIAKILDFYKLKSLPKALEEYYKLVDYITVQYAYRLKNNRISIGCTSMFATDDFLSGKRFSGGKRTEKNYLKNLVWNDTDHPDFISKVKSYFIVDYVDTTSNTYVLGKFTPNKKAIQLFFYKYPHFIFPLNLNLLEYVAIAEKCRGIEMWQNYFIDLKAISKEEKAYLENERTVNVPEIAKEIFPKIDISIYFQNHYFNTNYIDKCIEKDYFTLIKNKLKILEEKTYKAKGFFQLKTEFKDHPKPLEVQSINKAEYILGRKLPDEMLNFYLQYNGFSLSWKINKAEANFEILPFQQIFGGREPHKKKHWQAGQYEGIVSMQNAMSEEDLKIASESFPLLFSEFIDVVFHFPKNKPMQLYAIIKGEYIPLAITFKEFIDLFLTVMGINFWHYLLPEFLKNEEKIHKEVVKQVKKLFPNEKNGYLEKLN